MNFSTKIKYELCNKIIDDNFSSAAELLSILFITAKLNIANKKLSIKIDTHQEFIADYILSIIRKLFNINELSLNKVEKTQIFKERYEILINDSKIVNYILNNFLNFNGLYFDYKKSINKILVNNSLVYRFFKGLFIACGSISNPYEQYMLQFDFENNEELLEIILNILYDVKFNFNYYKKKKRTIIYSKNSNIITEFIAKIGATNSYLEFENIRIEKNLSKNINRKNNFEIANLSKTIKSSSKYSIYIKLIDEKIGLDNLDKKLYEVAKLKLENPELDLNSLGNKLKPPVSKSGVYHRLKKIEKIYNDLKKSNN